MKVLEAAQPKSAGINAILTACRHCCRQGSADGATNAESVGAGRQHFIGSVVQMLWKREKSSLNAKVMRLLAVVVAILLAGNGLVFVFVIWPTFTDLETGAAQQNLQS